MKTWTVYIDGGKNDGKVLAAFPDMWDAEKFATDYYMQHYDEFNPASCMLCIEDESGNIDIDW